MKNIFYRVILSIIVLLGVSSLTYANSPDVCGYVIDGVVVSFCSEEIMDVDVASFEIINEIYAKDVNQSYYEGKVIVDADPVSFEVVDGFWSKDANNVYCANSVLTSDVDTFKVYEEYSLWALDSENVYYICTKFEDSDPESLMRIDGDFFKDANNIYYQAFYVHADIDSFEVLGRGYAKDKDNVFFRYDGLIDGADWESFQLISFESDGIDEECGDVYFDASDENSCYAFGKLVLAKNNIVISDKPYFNDIQKDSLDYFYEKGMFIGYEDGSFGYDKPLTRAELLKIVMVAAEVDVSGKESDCFIDVKTGDWYASYVCEAKDMDFINGYPDGSFKPNSPTNKVEALKMIAEVLNWNMDADLAGTVEVYNDTYVSEWYFKYVLNGLDKFYIELNESMLFDPANEITRGDAAEVLFRTVLSNAVKGGAGFLNDYDLSTSSREFLRMNDGTYRHLNIPYLSQEYDGVMIKDEYLLLFEGEPYEILNDLPNNEVFGKLIHNWHTKISEMKSVYIQALEKINNLSEFSLTNDPFILEARVKVYRDYLDVYDKYYVDSSYLIGRMFGNIGIAKEALGAEMYEILNNLAIEQQNFFQDYNKQKNIDIYYEYIRLQFFNDHLSEFDVDDSGNLNWQTPELEQEYQELVIN